ncbi:hypothetical protein DEU56DRAFT_874197 [Suillus clintonianus]|uniref:uncharacterized protein n=1 Tax=Suillus clintonianus TaxID=1904413 RepID=UPI001B877087|nr:uncharacterized protein DEU56DRAFT_874197 [Suillus clintonianus]KAG2116140.1 hypothetical protein DEU56DRAFT_874197 [Suillus clintonianus]
MPIFLPSIEPILDGDCLSLKNIQLVDIFSRKHASLQPCPSHWYPNEILIYHGYLGCSPLFPTVAISICTLAAFRQAHQTCPRFSIQAQCKALCHLHHFSDTYDIYLEILHHVNILINKALNRNTPNWRLLNSCLCCFYKLQDEESLALEWLVTMDGNNSLKRWTSSATGGTTTRTDSHRFCSDYWLDCPTVDKFKDENPTEGADNWQDVEQTETAPSFTCVDQWQNAGPEQRKRMFSVFDESGIFIAACRHRLILLTCDMVKSGELAKYPLAIVDQLLTVYGRNGGFAYDIGCAFAKTLACGEVVCTLGTVLWDRALLTSTFG